MDQGEGEGGGPVERRRTDSVHDETRTKREMHVETDNRCVGEASSSLLMDVGGTIQSRGVAVLGHSVDNTQESPTNE